jgi:hypothetical protein
MTVFGSGSTGPVSGVAVSARRPTALLNPWHLQQQQQQALASAHTADAVAMLPNPACGFAPPSMSPLGAQHSAPANVCISSTEGSDMLVASSSRGSFTWPHHQQQQQAPARPPKAPVVRTGVAAAAAAAGMCAPLP